MEKTKTSNPPEETVTVAQAATAAATKALRRRELANSPETRSAAWPMIKKTYIAAYAHGADFGFNLHKKACEDEKKEDNKDPNQLELFGEPGESAREESGSNPPGTSAS